MVNEKLKGIHFDILKEIGNIGAGNAATALAQLLNKKIEMNVPKVNILPINEIPEVFGNIEDLVVVVYMRLTGKITGNILFVLGEQDALKLLNMLVGQDIDSLLELDEMQKSAMLEIGNIITGSYISALSDFIKMPMIPSVPAISIDMLGAVLSTPLIEMYYKGDTALLIETKFMDNENHLKGHFILIPDPKSIGVVFTALGVNYNGSG